MFSFTPDTTPSPFQISTPLLSMQVMLNPFSEAMSWAGGWGRAAAISFCCSLFLTLFFSLLIPFYMFPLLWCGLIHGLQSLQEVHAPACAYLQVAVFSGVCLWQCGLSTGCSPFRGVTSSTMEHLLLLWPCYSFCVCVFNLLKYVFTEMPSTPLAGSYVSCSESVGVGWTGCVWHRAASGLFSQASPMQTPLHCQNLGFIPTTVCLFIYFKIVVCKLLQALILLWKSC